MRVTEQYFSKNNQNENKKKKKKDINDEPDHMEMDAYHEAHSWFSDDESESVFKSKLSTGINSEKSVFDRQAVFHTRSGDGE